MSRRLRPDREKQRQETAAERQAAYDALSPTEKKAKEEAWGPGRR